MSGRSVVLVALLALGATAAPAGATYPGTNGLITWEQATPKGPPSNLHVINPDGTGDHAVFATGNHEGEGTFSPTDSAQMAFARGPFRNGDFVGPPEIYVGDMTTGLARRVTNFHSDTIAPTFSPDGKRIVFMTDKAFISRRKARGCCPWDIYTMNVDGSGLKRLTVSRLRGAEKFDPDWSPDGARVVYTEGRPVGKDGTQNRIAIMNADGSGKRVLTQFGGPDEINPKWFPDGRRIAFESRRPKDSDIMAMNPDGTGVSTVLATPYWDTNPIPSPDGTKIAFTSDRDRPGRPGDRLGPGFELYTMNVDGTGITRLTNNRVRDLFPDWQRLP